MKKNFMPLLVMIVLITSCNNQTPSPLIGTWQLVAATSTEGAKTVSTFDPKVKMIKIINPTHFSFFSHDLNNGKDSSNNSFSAGAGPYTLKDSIYTEHLEYFNERKWEGNSFDFIIKFNGDTLIQKGVEKVEGLGIDHIIEEKYIKIKN
jgi:hypothetical protein